MSKLIGIFASFFHFLPGAIVGALARGDMLPVVMIAVISDLVLRFGKQRIRQPVRAVRHSDENH